MVNNVETYYANSLMSEASYGKGLQDAIGAENIDNNPNTQYKSYINSLKASGFSDAQAEIFASKYSVVSHIPNTASGFSAT